MMTNVIPTLHATARVRREICVLAATAGGADRLVEAHVGTARVARTAGQLDVALALR
jgi:hypothetical protein